MRIDRFAERFTSLTEGWTWEVQGFLDMKGLVHPIDSDTKVLSTVFERLSSPVIRTIAKEHGYTVELSNQTTYPDFTLEQKVKTGIDRIAIDIESTYRSRQMGFTLGGYNSFLRNDTKNILYPYSTYSHHWVIAFVYNQLAKFEEYDLTNLPRPGDIRCPYGDVRIYIRDKHLLAGLRAGSGNTKNIGSVKFAEDSEFSSCIGPFGLFSDSVGAFHEYWRKYESYVVEIAFLTLVLRQTACLNFSLL